MHSLGVFRVLALAVLLLGAVFMRADAAEAPSTPKAPSAQDCNLPERSLTGAQLIGIWTDDRGETLEIVPDPRDTAHFTAKGKYDWDGRFQNGQLTLTRKPAPTEMGPNIPEWARPQVNGKVTWRIVVKGVQKCERARLEGKWYPQTVEFVEEYDSDDALVQQTAAVVDGGELDVAYEIHSPSKVFLYAVTAHGLQVIDELYLGVATVVEVQFDAESERREVEVELAIGDQKIALVARRHDQRGRIFRTEPFLPEVKKLSKDEIWAVPGAPKEKD